MNRYSWDEFVRARKRFRCLTEKIKNNYPKLKAVYNSSLDEIAQDSEIKLILAGDNPGKREYEQKRYLVGPSGKIAAKFFRDNPALGIDFYKNVIILNKTPIHTNRTIELRKLCKTGGASFVKALKDTQVFMARLLLEFQETLEVPVYITGYSEMKKGKLFETYAEELKRLYRDKPKLYKQLFIFRHFSMNQFTIDFKKKALPNENAKKTLLRIGTDYRHAILGML